ncbi:MAG: DUF3857 domain-containing transglutaminase family protein, partial [Burkholderiales bacterium]|nr:DUF3857 domain-containing transglutaminase family protein [Burkholderiales bacterium]
MLAIYSMPSYAVAQQSPQVLKERVSTIAPTNSMTRNPIIPSWVDMTLKESNTVSDDPVVIRLDDAQFFVDQEPTLFRHRMLRVNEPGMLSKVGQIEIPIHPEYEKVTLHTLKIIRGNKQIDKIDDVDVRFLQREQELDAGVLTGTVTVSLVVDDIRVGDTLDVAYSISGQNPVFANMISQFFYWDSIYLTQKKRVLFNAPDNRVINYKILGGRSSDLQIKEQRLGGRKITRILGENIPPLEFETYAPSDIDQFRLIQFSEYRDWNQVAQWANNLFFWNKKTAVVDQLATTFKQTENKQELVQNALQYVQKEIRYLSVSIGENSHRPYEPDVVLARRYGDCKDKALLLVSILRELGVSAEPVLVSTYYRNGLSRMLPSPVIFDHAIVKVDVDGQTYFLDPTRSVQTSSLDKMGQTHFANDVLTVSAETSRLTKIPTLSTTTSPTNRLIEHARLEKIDGAAEFESTYYLSGLEAEAMRVYFAQQTKEQIFKAYSAIVLQHYPTAEMVIAPIIQDRKKENEIEVTLKFKVPRFLEKKNRSWSAHYFPSNLQNRFYIPQSPRRVHPLLVPVMPTYSHYSFEL